MTDVKWHPLALLAPALVLGLLVAPVRRSGAAEVASPGKTDRAFLIDAASGNMMEVELGQYADKHAGNDRVQQFGRRMVNDHGRASDDLKQLAARQQVVLPAR